MLASVTQILFMHATLNTVWQSYLPVSSRQEKKTKTRTGLISKYITEEIYKAKHAINFPHLGLTHSAEY